MKPSNVMRDLINRSFQTFFEISRLKLSKMGGSELNSVNEFHLKKKFDDVKLNQS